MRPSQSKQYLSCSGGPNGNVELTESENDSQEYENLEEVTPIVVTSSAKKNHFTLSKIASVPVPVKGGKLFPVVAPKSNAPSRRTTPFEQVRGEIKLTEMKRPLV